MKVTIDGQVIEGTAEEIKEYFELLGAEFPVKGAKEQPRTVKRKARVGERILITDAIGKPYKNGDILTVTDIGGLGLPICGDYESFFHEEYEVIVEDKPHTFEVGDSVKVLAAGEFGGVDVGEIGTVTRVVTLKGDPYSIRVDGEDDHDYFRPQDLELVSEEKPKFKVGDYAKVVNYPNHYQNGTIVKIVNNEYSVIFPYDTQNLNGSEGDCHKEENLVKATDEEVAQAKRDSVFAKLGRKPDEFKKGDIVEFTDDYTDIGVVEAVGGSILGVRTKRELRSYQTPETSSVKLIAPVEARVDR